MSDDNNFNGSYSDVSRYIGKKMNNSERIRFEKELESDVFLKDAVEGLSKLKTDDIEDDLTSLSFIRPNKIQFQKVVIFLFIIAILALSFFVFIWNNKNIEDDGIKDESAEASFTLKKKQKNVDSLKDDSITLSLADSLDVMNDDSIQAVSDTVQEKTKKTYNLQINTEQAEAKQEVKQNNKDERNGDERDSVYLSPDNEKTEITSENDSSDNITEDVPSDKEQQGSLPDIYENSVIEELNESNSELMDIKKKVRAEDDIEETWQGQEKESENNSVNKSYNEIEPRPGANADPYPLGGEALFDDYISNNLRYPLTGKGRQVVKVEFAVSLTGELDNFKVLRSPDDKAFQQEAIRVLSEGPKWSPAIEDGIPVESRENVRIVFRP